MINNIIEFAKSDKQFLFLGEFEVTDMHLKLAESVAQTRYLANVIINIEDKKGFKSSNSPRTYFMSLLTEMHFSFLLQANKTKNTKLTLPDMVCLDIDALKCKNDCAIETKDLVINLDIKSQYAQNRYKNVNVNEGHLKKAITRGTMFIFSIINTNSYDEKDDFKNVKSISNYIVKNSFVSENSEYCKLKDRIDGFHQCAFRKFK